MTQVRAARVAKPYLVAFAQERAFDA